MALRRVVLTHHNEPKPQGARWRRIGAKQHPDYLVRYDKGDMATGHTHCATLTDARKEASAIVQEGRKWAEVFRFWESGQRIGKAIVAEYAALSQAHA